MKYEIRKDDAVIGITKLEGGDLPMGFVFGAVEPTDFYVPGEETSGYRLFIQETKEEIATKTIAIEDHSVELGEQCIEVTVLISSAEVYERFFKHHLDAYDQKFS